MQISPRHCNQHRTNAFILQNFFNEFPTYQREHPYLFFAFQVKAGLGINIIGVAVVMLAVTTWAVPLFNLNTYPTWANITTPQLEAIFHLLPTCGTICQTSAGHQLTIRGGRPVDHQWWSRIFHALCFLFPRAIRLL